jgi:uncharacterized OsmC-like protein
VRIDQDLLRGNVEEHAARLGREPGEGFVRPVVTTRLVENVQAVSDFVQYGKEFSFRCDESEGRGGRGEHPSPLRYLLSGIAFCLQVWYAKGAALVGAELDELEIDVATFLDMRGEHKVDDVPPHPQWITIEARVASRSGTDRVLAMVDEANDRCPVSTLVAKAVPVYERILHNGAVVRDTMPAGQAP